MDKTVTRTAARSASITLFMIAALSLLPAVLYAGEYHNPKQRTFLKTTETLVCSQCHTMHGSQGGQSLIYGGAATVYPALIRAASIVQLCRTCHENNSLGMSNPTPPDIWNNTLGYTASAGEFADRNVVNEQNRHSVGSNNQTPPGSNPVINIPYFSCINCHDQHGNTNYRNLKKRPGNASSDITISYRLDGSGNCSDGAASPCDVENVTTGGSGATVNLYKYNRDKVTFIKAASNSNGIAPFCGGCHTDFHGAGGASNIGGTVAGDTGNSPWLRHPVRDVDINEAETNKHADRANWAGIPAAGRTRTLNPDNAAPTSATADDQPFCLSCHYAHGGGNPNNATDPTLDHSNLVFMDGSATPKINIDSSFNATTGRIRILCQQCHNQ